MAIFYSYVTVCHYQRVCCKTLDSEAQPTVWTIQTGAPFPTPWPSCRVSVYLDHLGGWWWSRAPEGPHKASPKPMTTDPPFGQRHGFIWFLSLNNGIHMVSIIQHRVLFASKRISPSNNWNLCINNGSWSSNMWIEHDLTKRLHWTWLGGYKLGGQKMTFVL